MDEKKAKKNKKKTSRKHRSSAWHRWRTDRATTTARREEACSVPGSGDFVTLRAQGVRKALAVSYDDLEGDPVRVSAALVRLYATLKRRNVMGGKDLGVSSAIST